jgi:predicted dehydrogenase
MPTTRFGVIGCGSAAVPVCKAIASVPLTALARVHDLDLNLARDLGEQYEVPYTTRLDDVLNDPDVDGVYIAVPHHLLTLLARQALEAGKHALIEKPMALTLEDADALITLAESSGLALGVFYEMRYASAFEKARALIRAGVIGEVTGVRIQTLIDKATAYWEVGYSGRSRSSWRGEKARAGGGVLLMNTSHLLDAAWYVTGLSVQRVSGEIGTLVADVEVEDTAVATLRYDNGAVASLFAGAHIAGARREERFEIYGTEGTLRLPDPYGTEPLQVFSRRGSDGIPPSVWHTLPVKPVNVFEKALSNFARAVQANIQPPINGHDAVRVLKIVLGIYESAAERRWVDLSRKEIQYATN